MESYDIIVVGGGLLGCFTARSLTRYRLKTAIFEKNADICTEVSRANTAIIYSGYDNKPGSLKARLCLNANSGFETLCGELCVPFKRCGSLMVAFGPRGERVLRQKMEQGTHNGVPGLRLLSRNELTALEPGLNPEASLALYSPTAGTVNPWELCIAAAENAVDNGAELFLNAEITAVTPIDGGYLVQAGHRRVKTRSIINCAGIFADKVSELAARPYFKIVPTRGDYIILDTKAAGIIRHIIFHEPEEKGKGATLIPTVDGNIMLGPSDEPAEDKTDFSVSASGLEFVRRTSKYVVPNIPEEHIIRSFAALRPNPFWLEPGTAGDMLVSARSINDFIIESPEGHPCFINMAGIKTPGLTCSKEIGDYAAELLIERLGGAAENPEYNPVRHKKERFSRLPLEKKLALDSPCEIVCRCREVTEEEIRASIRRTAGASTVDGVKRRTGACMGRCQGGFCTQRIIEILAEELGSDVSEIRKDAPGSLLISKAERV